MTFLQPTRSPPPTPQALGTALAIDMSASLEHHAMHAVAAFASRDARVLSKLQRTGCVVPGAQHISLRVSGRRGGCSYQPKLNQTKRN